MEKAKEQANEELVKKFLAAKNIDDLAAVLGCKRNTLLYYCRKDQSPKCYEAFLIPKRSGGKRLIVAPNRQLKYIQRRLSDILYKLYNPRKIAQGFVKGRNVLTNAGQHTGKALILNVDIQDFFGAIHFGRVLGLFCGHPFYFN